MSITNIIDLGIVMNRLCSSGYTNSAATALYGNYTTLATPMFNMIVSLFTPITITFMTKLIKEKCNMAEFTNTLKYELSISYQLFVPLTIGLCVYSEETLSILFKNSGVYIGSVLLIYLLLSIFILIPLSIINCALEALGDEKIPMISIIVGSIFKIISAYLMIGNTNFGICGAPISTLISYAVAFIISLLYLQVKRGVLLPILKTVGLPLVNSFISIFGIYPIYIFMSRKSNSILSFIISVIISIIVYILLNILDGNIKDLKKLKSQNVQITT
jgi:O-antigen/teichoic acid export membrane protein